MVNWGCVGDDLCIHRFTYRKGHTVVQKPFLFHNLPGQISLLSPTGHQPPSFLETSTYIQTYTETQPPYTFYPETGGIMYLWNVGHIVLEFTLSKHKRVELISTSLKFNISNFTCLIRWLSLLLKFQCNKPEGRGFDSRWGHWIFKLT
jgi:hypothetical protein